MTSSSQLPAAKREAGRLTAENARLRLALADSHASEATALTQRDALRESNQRLSEELTACLNDYTAEAERDDALRLAEEQRDRTNRAERSAEVLAAALNRVEKERDNARADAKQWERNAREMAAKRDVLSEQLIALRHGLAEQGFEPSGIGPVHDALGAVHALSQTRDDARNYAAATLATLDAHSHEVRLICDALDIPVPETADPILAAIEALKAKIQP